MKHVRERTITEVEILVDLNGRPRRKWVIAHCVRAGLAVTPAVHDHGFRITHIASGRCFGGMLYDTTSAAERELDRLAALCDWTVEHPRPNGKPVRFGGPDNARLRVP